MAQFDLLEPVLSRYKCVHSTSINSINQWAKQARPETTTSVADLALRKLVAAIDRYTEPTRGVRVCRPPGSDVAKEVLIAQEHVETTIQAPMIPDLLAGKLSQADYMSALKPTIDVDKPVDLQLLTNYSGNIVNLERMRDLAKQHLWPDPHGDWLPHLERDPTFLPKFSSLLSDALKRARFEPWLPERDLRPERAIHASGGRR